MIKTTATFVLASFCALGMFTAFSACSGRAVENASINSANISTVTSTAVTATTATSTVVSHRPEPTVFIAHD